MRVLSVRRAVAATAGVALAAVGVLTLAQAADASTTVTAQLALSGVVTDSSPAGGTVVGVHPGDAVNFKPALVGLPADSAVLGAVGGQLSSLLGSALPYRITIHPASNFPGGTKPIVLDSRGAGDKVAFPKKGTYDFSWSADQIGLLGLTTPIRLDGNQAASLGIRLNASNEWVGQVVVADNPPKGGISVQLPGVTLAPSVPVLGQLPTITVPKVAVPTLHVPTTLPSLPKLPTGGAGGGSSPGQSHVVYTPHGPGVEATTVPSGYGNGAGGDGSGAIGSGGTGSGGTGAAAYPAGVDPSGSARAGLAGNTTPIDLAQRAGGRSASALPLLWTVLAIAALSTAVAMYSRRFLGNSR